MKIFAGLMAAYAVLVVLVVSSVAEAAELVDCSPEQDGSIMCVDHVPGTEITLPLRAQNPTENIDGTPLTDLTMVKLYACTGEACVATEQPNNGDYPTTEPGAETQMPRTFTPNGDVGTTFVVRYRATALDSEGNESDYSNTKEYRITFIDAGIPQPPVILLPEERTVFHVIKQPNSFVLLPIGTAPAGTPCDPNQTVNGHGAVPTDAVAWSPGSTARPVVVVAQCGG